MNGSFVFSHVFPKYQWVLFVFLWNSSSFGNAWLLDTVLIHGTSEQTLPDVVISSNQEVPKDWTSGKIYRDGVVHYRLEVLEKPSNTIVYYQHCLRTSESDGTKACGEPYRFVENGLYQWSRSMRQWNVQESFDFSQISGVQSVTLMDAEQTPIDPSKGEWVGAPYVGIYYPIKVRLSAVVLGQGEHFAGWETLIPTTSTVVPFSKNSMLIRPFGKSWVFSGFQRGERIYHVGTYDAKGTYITKKWTIQSKTDNEIVIDLEGVSSVHAKWIRVQTSKGVYITPWVF